MSKLIGLTVENFKRLRAVRLAPAPSGVTVVAGRNGQGKSSVLDAIQAALGGGRVTPAEPVRRGEQKGLVVCELDDLVIRRSFTAAGGGTLTVAPKDGTANIKSPQATLDRLYGAFSFDPLEFLRLGPADRLKAILSLGGPEVAALEERRRGLRDRRTLLAREARDYRARADGLPHYPDAPADGWSVADLAREMREAQGAEAARADLTRQVAARTAEQERAERDSAAAIEESKRLRRLADESDARARDLLQTAVRLAEEGEALAERLAEFEVPDVAAIAQRMDEAAAVNAQVRANADRAAAMLTAKTAAEVAEAAEAELARLDAERRALLATALRAVPGLDLGPDGILLHDLPFEQASTSEQLRASVGLGVASNPGLRLLLVREGSLLDAASLAEVDRIAEEFDMQVLVETVSDSAGECGVVIEDGEVCR